MLDFLFLVRAGGDDEQAVEQINRDAVRTLVVGATDASNATVCGGHQHRRHVRLERSIEEREALDVEHVNLVDEQHLQREALDIKHVNFVDEQHLQHATNMQHTISYTQHGDTDTATPQELKIVSEIDACLQTDRM